MLDLSQKVTEKIREKAEELGIDLHSLGITEENFEEDVIAYALEFFCENLEDAPFDMDFELLDEEDSENFFLEEE